MNTENYKDAVLRDINLGDDTDTTGAVAGTLAGLAYGLESIPKKWRDQLAGHEKIQHIATSVPCWNELRHAT